MIIIRIHRFIKAVGEEPITGAPKYSVAFDIGGNSPWTTFYSEVDEHSIRILIENIRNMEYKPIVTREESPNGFIYQITGHLNVNVPSRW